MVRIVNISEKQKINEKDTLSPKNLLFCGDTFNFINNLPMTQMFDLVVTSPPYNLGKEYEEKVPLEDYYEWQKEILLAIYPRLKDTGSICWQVGNYIQNGEIVPLDIELSPIFKNDLSMKLRNRIIWHFGHGLHNKKRFSGRYEVIMWYTKTDQYIFNLDDVRIPSKYPGKRYHKGPNIGKISGNPSGKNPEDVWDIPNVKANHIEKTLHPCQFPVALIERLVLALTNENALVFDPFCGVASAGVATISNKRIFWGCDIEKSYLEIGQKRLIDVEKGQHNYRPLNKPIYDPAQSKLSLVPIEWLNKGGRIVENNLFVSQ